MNIIDQLLEEHEAIRSELLDLNCAGVPAEEKERKVRNLYRHFYRHEKAEHALLEEMAGAHEDGHLRPLFKNMEWAHERLWEKLDLVRLAVDARDMLLMDKVLRELDALARAHMAQEERGFFPEARKHLENAKSIAE